MCIWFRLAGAFKVSFALVSCEKLQKQLAQLFGPLRERKAGPGVMSPHAGAVIQWKSGVRGE